MSPVLLSSHRSPPSFLLIPRAAAATAPAVFLLEGSGNPSRPNGGGRRGALAVSSAYSGASRMLMNHRGTPSLSKYAYKYDDEDEKDDGDEDEDDLDFINGKSKQDLSQRLKEEHGLDDRYVPLIEYLSMFGLQESDFISIYERRPRLPTDVTHARKRLEFLLDVGVKQGDMRRVLKRQPQILEYSVENNLKPHVDFLRSIGIPESHIGPTICAAPALFSFSIEVSLKPAVKYLIEEIGIKASDVSKVVQLSPDILFQPIGNTWNARRSFFSRELCAPRDNIVKMVTVHPQLLHYSIEDGIKPRINFFRSIGMHNPEILKVLTGLAQVLSLSVERNLKPKCSYLVNELHNDVHSLTKYPKYLSLSLDQRIRPRHRFLVSLKRFHKGPFPLSAFLPSDERFCQKWARTSLEKYLAFKETLLLHRKTSKKI